MSPPVRSDINQYALDALMNSHKTSMWDRGFAKLSRFEKVVTIATLGLATLFNYVETRLKVKSFHELAKNVAVLNRAHLKAQEEYQTTAAKLEGPAYAAFDKMNAAKKALETATQSLVGRVKVVVAEHHTSEADIISAAQAMIQGSERVYTDSNDLLLAKTMWQPADAVFTQAYNADRYSPEALNARLEGFQFNLTRSFEDNIRMQMDLLIDEGFGRSGLKEMVVNFHAKKAQEMTDEAFATWKASVLAQPAAQTEAAIEKAKGTLSKLYQGIPVLEMNIKLKTEDLVNLRGLIAPGVLTEERNEELNQKAKSLESMINALTAELINAKEEFKALSDKFEETSSVFYNGKMWDFPTAENNKAPEVLTPIQGVFEKEFADVAAGNVAVLEAIRNPVVAKQEDAAKTVFANLDEVMEGEIPPPPCSYADHLQNLLFQDQADIIAMHHLFQAGCADLIAEAEHREASQVRFAEEPSVLSFRGSQAPSDAFMARANAVVQPQRHVRFAEEPSVLSFRGSQAPSDVAYDALIARSNALLARSPAAFMERANRVINDVDVYVPSSAISRSYMQAGIEQGMDPDGTIWRSAEC